MTNSGARTFSYELVRDSSYYAAALRSHQRVNLFRWVYRLVFLPAAAFFALAAYLAARDANYGIAAYLGGCALFLVSVVTLRRWLVVFRWRSAPGFGKPATFWLCSDGVRTETEEGEADLKWSAFSAAYRVPNGLLLYRGSALFHWLPDASLVSGEYPAAAASLVEESIPRYKDRS